MERGFSLSEVVVSLLLVTSISLALLKQQWQLHRLIQKTQQQAMQWLHAHNDYERKTLNQQGLSILELMVGLVLALGIITALIQQYVQIKQQFDAAQTTIAHFTRSQLALDFIQTSVQQAGFTPCLSLSHLKTLDQRNQRPLTSIDWKSTQPDTLQVSRMRDGFVEVNTIHHQRQIDLSSAISTPQGPLVIADCYHAEVHQAYVIQGSSIMLFHPLVYIYHPPVYVGEWLESSFSMKPNHEGRMSMFYHHLHSEELLPDIKSMVWHVEKSQQQTLIHLDVTLANTQTIPLDIRVRQP